METQEMFHKNLQIKPRVLFDAKNKQHRAIAKKCFDPKSQLFIWSKSPTGTCPFICDGGDIQSSIKNALLSVLL